MDSTKLVKKYQCPGCVVGSDPDCGRFKPDPERGGACAAHVCGTYMMPGGHIALGLPKGFCKTGLKPTDRNGEGWESYSKLNLRFWQRGAKPGWNNLNVPVWAMEYEGDLLVRTFMPRWNFGAVDVIEGGKLSDAPGAVNVADLQSDID